MKNRPPAKNGYVIEYAAAQRGAPCDVSPTYGSIQSSEPTVKSVAPVAKVTATQYGTL